MCKHPRKQYSLKVERNTFKLYKNEEEQIHSQSNRQHPQGV